jgi:recombination protein RecR
MNAIQKLTELFSKFPGIGPRQSKRFVYFLLSQNNSYIQELVREIEELKKESIMCDSCFRFFAKNGGKTRLCNICSNTERDQSKLMIVSQDVDLENIERTGAYDGLYLVLGGTVPVLDKEPDKKIRTKGLVDTITARAGEKLSEIILAMNANIEGENTGEYIEEKIKPLVEKHKLKISKLGRGLSTGSELEYSDSDTIANALKNRA